MIYFDNAATTWPKPPEVYCAAAEAAGRYFANPGRGGYPAAMESEKAVYAARRRLADFFGAGSPENIIFTANCTASVNYVLKGCLQPGDHVIISDLEHNAVVRPLYALQRQGVQVTRVSVLNKDPWQIAAEFGRQIRRNTRMIFCTHASNVLGVVLPVKQIGAVCRRYGLIFGIDAAQSAGVLPLDIRECGADFVCVPAHKGLYGLMGLGVLVCSGRVLPESLIEGGTGSLSTQREQPDFLPDRLESGTLNVPGICALDSGTAAVQRAGTDKIYRHEMELVRNIYSELNRMRGVKLYTGVPETGRHVPLLSFNIGDMAADEAGERLAAMGIAVRAGLHCAADAHNAAGTAERGTVRICPSMYTSECECSRLLAAVHSII